MRFASVDDPRMERAGKRNLGEIIAGADSRVDIETFGSAKIDRRETLIELPNGILSIGAFGRVFSLIDARSFQDLFIEWTKRVWEATEGQVVAIDGKTAGRSADKANGESPIYMAGAWGTANGVTLGQVKTDDHSNEITAIPELLKTLEIKGCVATIDAMDCRKKIARETVKQGADYVSAVNKNQPQLWDAAAAYEYGERTRFSTMKRDVFVP